MSVAWNFGALKSYDHYQFRILFPMGSRGWVLSCLFPNHDSDPVVQRKQKIRKKNVNRQVLLFPP